MGEVIETQLPGVGVRLDFTTSHGEQVAVIVHRGGERELMLYDDDDPDQCSTFLRLDVDDAHTLNEVLGGSRVSEVASAVERSVEGIAIDWLAVPDSSASVGSTIGNGRIRTRTGVSIVAVVRGQETFPAPGPDFVFAAGDIAVAVGTPPGITEARDLLES